MMEPSTDRSKKRNQSALPVLRLDERHRCEHRLPQLVANFYLDLRALFVPARLDISHRDILAHTG